MSKVPLLTVSTVDNTLLNNVNSNSATITAAFDNTLSRDGTSPNQMNSVLDMNSHPIINIPFATTPTQPVALGQVTPNTTFIPVLSGDVSSGSFNGTTLPTTLATVNSNVGSFGSSTQVPVITVNAKGLTTAVSTATINTTNITNSQLANMNANTVKGNPTGSSATPQDVTPQTARSSSLLNVESVTFVPPSNYSILTTDRFLQLASTVSSPITWTLPRANTVNPGHVIYIEMWNASPTNTFTLAATSPDLITFRDAGNLSSITWSEYVQVIVISSGSGWQLASFSTNFTSAFPGIVPASGGGTTNFLRADGAWVNPSGVSLVNTLTASNSASLSDTTSLTGSFSTYMIVFTNLIPASTNGPFNLLVHSGGSFQTSGYTGGGNRFNNGGQGWTNFGSNIQLVNNTSIGSPGVSGTLYVSNVTQTSSPKQFYGLLSANGEIDIIGGAWSGGSGVVDGFQVSFASANISSGTIKIYGII